MRPPAAMAAAAPDEDPLRSAVPQPAPVAGPADQGSPTVRAGLLRNLDPLARGGVRRDVEPARPYDGQGCFDHPARTLSAGPRPGGVLFVTELSSPLRASSGTADRPQGTLPKHAEPASVRGAGNTRHHDRDRREVPRVQTGAVRQADLAQAGLLRHRRDQRYRPAGRRQLPLCDAPQGSRLRRADRRRLPRLVQAVDPAERQRRQGAARRIRTQERLA